MGMKHKNIKYSFEIADLLAGYLQFTLSESQKEELFKWIDESEDNRKLFIKILNEQNLEMLLAEFTTYDAQAALIKLRSKRGDVKKVTRSASLWVKISVAASLLLMISCGLWFYRNQQPRVQPVAQTKKDIAPGGNRAILTLANGTKIVLDSISTGEIAQQGGVTVTKTTDGKVIYNASRIANSAPVTEGYNTITTPRGGQYQVILPDGSQVWLNAASSIRFPTAFTHSKREVEITGEAYFEVTKNRRKPFRVLSGDQTVEVLGTHFDIMAYADEKAYVTTLVEGSVAVSNQKRRIVINPGENVILQRDKGTLTVNQTDARAAVMWKNGYFYFDDEPIEEIMRKVSRWYDVEIIYKGNIAGKTFGGNISKFKNVSELLDVLQVTGSIHFKIEERRIIVMP